MISANDLSLVSWLNISKNTDFPVQNIPFGVFKYENKPPRVATRIGDTVVDLWLLATEGSLDIDPEIFLQKDINAFMALGKSITSPIRNQIAALLAKGGDPALETNKVLQGEVFYDISEVEMIMPVSVGDYTDFYSSREHATNVGTMFRDPENALLPNWLHLPVGYHGRASSIVVSGTDFHRPKGQTMPAGAEKPVYGPCKLLDFELEMGFVVGTPNKLGHQITTAKGEEHIFGLCLFNDWSARDIQKWEYVPLGPFLGKSFCSTISPWIVTLEALEHFKISGPEQTEPEVLPYLKYKGKKRYDIQLEVALKPAGGQETVISRSNFKYMYWNMCQQLAHHTVNGCNMKTGDMCGSGTISGTTPDSFGSMLELSWKGTKPLKLNDGSERKFLKDGDTLILRGYGEKDGVRIGFGEVRGTVLPAL